MSELINVNKEYAEWISDVSKRFRSSQRKAASHVNSEMLKFYWELGGDLSVREKTGMYGSGFYENVSKDLMKGIPGIKSFSVTNLRYMKSFYELYCKKNNNEDLIKKSIPPQIGEEFKKDEIVQQSVAQLENLSNPPQIVEKFKKEEITSEEGKKVEAKAILPQFGGKSPDNGIVPQFVGQSENKIFRIPWGHHRIIIDKCRGNQKKALFFVDKTIENNWSRAVLLNFLETDLYERNGKAITNFKETLSELGGELVQEMTKDPYCFDFLTLREDYNEKELKEALLDNIQKFLLELGNGFTFAGKEYRLTIGKTEQYLDMLFYNVPNHCYVVIEVKISEFTPSDMGQLGTYVAAVDDLLKKEGDHPTVGLLICKTKDNILAKYAVKATNVPVGISEYQLSSLVPEEYQGSLPTIEEIERGLRNL